MDKIRNIFIAFKLYSDILIINLLSLAIGLGAYYFYDKIEILVAVIATGLSLSLGIRQYRTENDKLFKDLFYDFNKKYDSTFNNILNSIDIEFRENGNYEISTNDKKIIIDYINMCAEEYLWYSKNRIPSEVWNSWKNGMIYFMNIKPINEIVINQKIQKDSFYCLFDEIGKEINNWKK